MKKYLLLLLLSLLLLPLLLRWRWRVTGQLVGACLPVGQPAAPFGGARLLPASLGLDRRRRRALASFHAPAAAPAAVRGEDGDLLSDVSGPDDAPDVQRCGGGGGGILRPIAPGVWGGGLLGLRSGQSLIGGEDAAAPVLRPLLE